MGTTITTPAQPRMPLAEAQVRLCGIDLTDTRIRLADTVTGPGWPLHRLNRAEREYRRFLKLSLMFPDEAIVPCRDVDTFGRTHRLDGRHFERDFREVFGHARPAALEALSDAGTPAGAPQATCERTLELYQAVFGTPPSEVWREERTMRFSQRTGDHEAWLAAS